MLEPMCSHYSDTQFDNRNRQIEIGPKLLSKNKLTIIFVFQTVRTTLPLGTVMHRKNFTAQLYIDMGLMSKLSEELRVKLGPRGLYLVSSESP